MIKHLEITTAKEKNCLLIGNSRWHWALKKRDGWEFIHTSIETDKTEWLKHLQTPLFAWAAVGEIPPNISLDPSLKINLKDVPLIKCPPWLGIDRALAAWGAFQKSIQSCTMNPNGLLIADAGTVLSLTRIKANGEFLGGQLVPGLGLQLQSMTKGTKNLQYPSNQNYPSESFPISTEAAMLKGSIQSLLGTIIEAKQISQVPVWLCGGDAPIILKNLQKRNIEVLHQPNLVLEGMVNLQNYIKQSPNH